MMSNQRAKIAITPIPVYGSSNTYFYEAPKFQITNLSALLKLDFDIINIYQLKSDNFLLKYKRLLQALTLT